MRIKQDLSIQLVDIEFDIDLFCYEDSDSLDDDSDEFFRTVVTDSNETVVFEIEE